MGSNWDSVVRDVLARNLPGLAVATVEALGAGRDNAAFAVNGTLVVRFSTAPDPSMRATVVVSEAELLELVATASPLPVPVPRFTDADAGCLAYDLLPGVQLLDLPPQEVVRHAEDVAGPLGEFLSVLHGLPLDRMARLVDPDEVAPREWLHEAAVYHATVADQVPPRHRDAVLRFLATEPPAADYEPVFSHNDLGAEHVLVDPRTWRVTGVIDWTDAAIVDPAFDFGKLHRDLGPAALPTALRHYRGGDPAGIAERAAFYARCTVFEDLEHGITTDQHAYVAKCLASLSWLFPG
jgi:aminoglycoside phosphotransferase (APT) family kinase protein